MKSKLRFVGGLGGDISGIAHFPWIDLPKIFVNADDFMTFLRRWARIATVLCVITLLSLGRKDGVC
jgi:hypothetical protein